MSSEVSRVSQDSLSCTGLTTAQREIKRKKLEAKKKKKQWGNGVGGILIRGLILARYRLQIETPP